MRFVDLTSFLGLYADFAAFFYIADSGLLCQDAQKYFWGKWCGRSIKISN